jgi:SNF2 family DNA or RNA helicase
MTIKINLSRPVEGERRKIVLTCTEDESIDIHPMIISEVLGFRAHPEKKTLRRGRYAECPMVKYYFAQSYLERLKLTFPYADISEGLDRRLLRRAKREYEAREVPNVRIPWLAEGMTPMGHQAVAYKDLITPDEDGAFPVKYLDDEMGLGKTFVALAVYITMMLRARRQGDLRRGLAIVPNSSKFTSWLKDARTFFPRLRVGVVDSNTQTPAERTAVIEDTSLHLVVINWESNWRYPELYQQDWLLTIVDEYHRAKNPTANQAIALTHIKTDDWLWMSGTPILNGRPEELWTTLNRLWPNKYPDYNLFKNNLYIKGKNNKKLIGYRYAAMEGLQRTLDGHEIRRRKDQVLRDLPPRIYQRLTTEMSAEQRRHYRGVIEELRIYLEDGSVHPIVSVLSMITRAKQAAWGPELYGGRSHRSAKVDKVKELVAELSANGEKAIVFSQWKKATRILRRELEAAGYQVAYIDGDVPPMQRAEEVERFQTDEDCKVFIGTIGACRESLTLTAASYVIFTDKGWTPAENEQAAARAHRIGQTRTVNVIEIFSEGTIESDIEDLLQSKQNVFNALIERDGGVRYHRGMLSDIRSLLGIDVEEEDSEPEPEEDDGADAA